jgi:hypothetical protein
MAPDLDPETLRCERCDRTRHLTPNVLEEHSRPADVRRGPSPTHQAAKRWAARNQWTNGHLIICPKCQSSA